MSDQDIARCSSQTHFRVSKDRRYISKRCYDDRCVEVIYAKSTGQIAIHVFDLWTPPDEPQLRMRTEFEIQVRRQRDENNF